MDETDGSKVSDPQGVCFIGEKYDVCRVQQLKPLGIYGEQAVHCVHEVILHYFPAGFEEGSSEAVRIGSLVERHEFLLWLRPHPGRKVPQAPSRRARMKGPND